MGRAACAVVLLGMALLVTTAAGAQIDLTGTWAVTGSDDAGTQWTGQLQIGQGLESGGRCPLTGSIFWEATGGEFASSVSAWEDFRDGVYGTQAYFNPAAMTVYIEGYQIREDTSGGRIRQAQTQATVSADGLHMLDGTGAGASVVPGSWKADRVGDVVSLTIANGVVSGNAIVFSLHLSAASDQPVTVEHETADDTAVVTEDYGYTYGTLTIAPGDISATISVPLLKNATPGTRFFMRLYKVSDNAIVATREAVGEIPADWTVVPGNGTPAGSGGGTCGQGVGAGNLIAFCAICWLGLATAKWRRYG